MALGIKRTRSGGFSKVISTSLMVLALAIQPMYGLVAGQAANAATQPFSAEAVCQDGKVTLKLTTRQADMPDVPPQDARNWHANVRYQTNGYGDKSQSLPKDDIDTWTVETGKYAIGNEEVSARVLGGYTLKEDIIVFGRKVGSWDKPYVYNNTFTASSLSKKCDTTPPEVEVISPDLNSIHNKNISIEAKVSDAESGLDKVVLNVSRPSGNNFGCTQANNLNGAKQVTLNCTINISGRDDGQYGLVVRTHDMVGNLTDVRTHKFTVNRTAPGAEVAVGSLSRGAYTNNKNIAIKGVGTPAPFGTDIKTHYFYLTRPVDAAAVNVYSDRSGYGVCALNGANECSFSLAEHYTGDGRYEVRYVITDQQGHRNDGHLTPWLTGLNTEAAKFVFNVDTSRPSVEENQTKSSSPDYNPESFTVEASDVNGAADSGVRQVVGNVYKYDPAYSGPNSKKGDYYLLKSYQENLSEVRQSSESLDVSLNWLGEGKYYVLYNAKDHANNNSNNEHYYFIVDRTNPVVSITDNSNSTIGDHKSWKNARHVAGKIEEANLDETQLFRVSDDGDTEVTNRLTIDGNTFKVNNGLPEGTYYIVHTDKVGRKSEPAHFVISNKKPLVSEVKGVGDIARDSEIIVGPNTAEVDFTIGNGDNANAIVDQVMVRGWVFDSTSSNNRGTAAFDNSDITKNPTTGSYAISLKELLETKSNWINGGRFIIMIEARNQAHVRDQYFFVVNVVTEAPSAPTITGGVGDNTYTARAISGTAAPNTLIRVTIGDMTRETTSNDSGDWNVLFAGLAVGNHQVSAVAVDAAGNVSKAGSARFEVLPAVQGGTLGRSQLADSVSGNSTEGITGAAFSNIFTLPGEAADNDNSNASILGAQTERQASPVSTAAAVPTADGWKIFGLLWYWWLLILAAVAGIWWFIAAARRRNEEETV